MGQYDELIKQIMGELVRNFIPRSPVNDSDAIKQEYESRAREIVALCNGRRSVAAQLADAARVIEKQCGSSTKAFSASQLQALSAHIAQQEATKASVLQIVSRTSTPASICEMLFKEFKIEPRAGVTT